MSHRIHENEDEVADLHEERDRLHRFIARFATSIRIAPVNTYHESMVNMKQAELDGLWKRFQEASTSLLQMLDPDNEEEMNAHDHENLLVADLYEEASEALSLRWRTIKDARRRPTLPKPTEIQLPKFGGKYTAWINWRAQFVSKVKDTQLSAGEKIDLLLNALTGEARQCAGETEHRDDSDFQRMWCKLEATYDNKYQIVTEHISKLIDLPQMSNPVPETLRRIIDTVEQELRSLERFEYDTRAWDPLIAVMVLRKLDPVTIGIWEMDRDPVKPPSLKDVLPFIEKRILAIRNLKVRQSQCSSLRGDVGTSTTTTSNENQTPVEAATRNPFKRNAPDGNVSRHGKRPRPAIESAGGTDGAKAPEPPMCPNATCETRHFLWHCKVFKDWSLDKRLNMVGEWGLCPCCLVAKHAAAKCSRDGCRRCDMAKHNNMLCPRHMVFRVNAVSTGKNRKARRGFAPTQ